MLRVTNLDVAYGSFQVLWGVHLEVNQGEIVSILGPNGAGKSTLMNTIARLVPLKGGSIEFFRQKINHIPPYKIVSLGISHVLERRRVFADMTVYENLLLGAYTPHAKKYREQTLEWVLTLFPRLEERKSQLAGTMSGGEQQMLAIGRGLMARPKLLMADEPFLGLAPLIMLYIIKIMKKINQEGVTVLFIEQNVQQALDISDRGYILESGQVALEGKSKDLLTDRTVREIYLGTS
ncbi:MAG: ABC transporter ATP-binding protein [Thermodesulfobacteriota bacterium]